MNVLSLFSGVGGLDLGLERAGLTVVGQCEIDPWRRKVLAWHWPSVPCLHAVQDVDGGWNGGGGLRATADRGRTARADGQQGAVDLLCGGFPCQDLSVAGRRAGLVNGHRSSLFFEFARIADELRPRWLLVENVPGLLSSADGRDFAIVLRTLADIGYGLAWRVLDARYFGVPQRRRRVFIVGHLGGDPESALQALGASGDGHPQASQCTWQNAAHRARDGARIARALTTSQERNGDGYDQDFVVAHALTAEGHDASEDGTGRGTPLVVNALDRSAGGPDDNAAQAGHLIPQAIGFHLTQDPINGPQVPALGRKSTGQGVFGFRTSSLDAPRDDGQAPPLTRNANGQGTGSGPAGFVGGNVTQGVRRLLPIECERLMSWPDDWTNLDGTASGGIGGRAAVRRQTLEARVERAALLAADDEQWIVWCGLNDEANACATAIDGAVNVEGTWAPDDKAAALEAFQDGEIRVLVSKPAICGFGMNFQNASRMAFVGLGDSYEAYYQAIRRCWRFGQTQPVQAHIIVSRLEDQIVQNVRRKEREADRMTDQLVRHMARPTEAVA